MTSMIPEAPEMPQPCDEWEDLHRAACAAGEWAARELLKRCSAWQLGRHGQARVHVEPGDSPVAVWLHQHGHATLTEADTSVRQDVALSSRHARPCPPAPGEPASVLVSHAYAAAYCTVLAEEAGVTTTVEITTSPAPRRSSGVELAPASGPADVRPAAAEHV